MENLKNTLLFTALGVSGGLSGLLSAVKCPGNACTSCFGCAGIGAGILAAAAIRKLKGGEEKSDGMA